MFLPSIIMAKLRLIYAPIGPITVAWISTAVLVRKGSTSDFPDPFKIPLSHVKDLGQ